MSVVVKLGVIDGVDCRYPVDVVRDTENDGDIHMNLKQHVFNLDHMTDILWHLEHNVPENPMVARLSGSWRVGHCTYTIWWDSLDVNDANCKLADFSTWLAFKPKADKLGVISLYPDAFVVRSDLEVLQSENFLGGLH